MFRKMRRFKQEISEEECIGILSSEPRGILSVNGDGGYPYAFPISHYFCKNDGHIYFHCAKEGHKTDSIEKDDRVCFCVHDSGYRNEGEWALNIKSVIVFGRIKKVTDEEKIKDILKNLGYKFTSDEEYITKEIRDNINRVQILELVPEHITGKKVNES